MTLSKQSSEKEKPSAPKKSDNKQGNQILDLDAIQQMVDYNKQQEQQNKEFKPKSPKKINLEDFKQGNSIKII